MKVQIHDKKFAPYLSEAAVQEAVQRMAQQIEADFAGKPLYLLGVLNGSFRLIADLARYISLPLEVGFVRLSSYAGTDTTGEVKMQTALPADLADKCVIIIEDIVDTGLTLQKLLATIQGLPVRSCHTLALLLKPSKLRVSVPLDYKGFEIPDAFVVGYGLDYDGLGRELNGIYSLAETE